LDLTGNKRHGLFSDVPLCMAFAGQMRLAGELFFEPAGPEIVIRRFEKLVSINKRAMRGSQP